MRGNKNWTVYKHTSPSGKVYIGITCQIPKKRWGHNGKGYKGCTHFTHAIEKYGWDNITHEILRTNLSETFAKKMEIFLISRYKRKNLSYNMTNGGDGRSIPWSESDRERFMPTLKKVLGVKISQFTLDGKYIKDYDTMEDAAKDVGIDRSSISRCCSGKSKTSGGFMWAFLGKIPSKYINNSIRRVSQFTKDGSFIETFDSIRIAAETTGVNYSSLRDHLYKPSCHKSCGGYIFKYYGK